MDGSFMEAAKTIVLGHAADTLARAEKPAFLTDGDTVFWQTAYGPAPLDASNVNGLLGLFEQMDGPAARKLWLDLYDAASRTDGFIPRVTSFRSSGVSPSYAGRGRS